MKPRYRNSRLGMITLLGVPVIVAGMLTFKMLDQSVSYFLIMTELATTIERPERIIRLDELVVEDSVVRGDGVLTVFKVCDGGAEITVRYNGILPDLFREGQGIIVEGSVLTDGRFDARQLLAKRAENYAPKELQHTLEKQYTL